MSANASVVAKATDTFFFGKDAMAFPESFAMPDTEKRKDLTRFCDAMHPAPRLGEGTVPMRKGVSMHRVPHFGLVALERGLYCRVSWQNIGYFLDEIKTSEQCESVIRILHENFSDCVIPGNIFQEALKDIRASQNNLRFEIFQDRLDEGVLSKGCFRRNGIWFMSFLYVESGKLVQYKYAIDKKKHVARKTAVILEWPHFTRRPGRHPWQYTDKERALVERNVACMRYLIGLTKRLKRTLKVESESGKAGGEAGDSVKVVPPR
jgi:hypothetical protein